MLSDCASLLVLEPSSVVVKLLVAVTADLTAYSKQKCEKRNKTVEVGARSAPTKV